MTQNEHFPPGSLAVIATPLGNLEDLSPRAAAILAAADIIAAEDTRTARRLLDARAVAGRLVSYHDWNEAGRAEWLLGKLAQGNRIALVSEAGTPCISDPGFDLVRAARKAGHKVFPVPGPSALITFLSASGLPTDAFSFFGFPPARKAKRRELFARLADRRETLVFYESPHRFADALADALEVFGDRTAAFGREMTKIHEEFAFGSISGLLELLKGRERIKGEVTWGVAGTPKETAGPSQSLEEELFARALNSGRPLKEVSKELSASTGAPAKDIYARLARMRSGPLD